MWTRKRYGAARSVLAKDARHDGAVAAANVLGLVLVDGHEDAHRRRKVEHLAIPTENDESAVGSRCKCVGVLNMNNVRNVLDGARLDERVPEALESARHAVHGKLEPPGLDLEKDGSACAQAVDIVPGES